jgi:hypothetical protein
MQFLRSIKSFQALSLAAATAATMATANIAPSMAQTPSTAGTAVFNGLPGKPIIRLTPPAPAANPVNFNLTNKGGYVARFEVSYSLNKNPFSLKTGDVTLNNRVTFSVPGDATDIRVSSFLFTGLFGETRQIFFNKFNTVPQTIPGNACFTVFGTTLSPQSNNDCRL